MAVSRVEFLFCLGLADVDKCEAVGLDKLARISAMCTPSRDDGCARPPRFRRRCDHAGVGCGDEFLRDTECLRPADEPASANAGASPRVRRVARVRRIQPDEASRSKPRGENLIALGVENDHDVLRIRHAFSTNTHTRHRHQLHAGRQRHRLGGSRGSPGTIPARGDIECPIARRPPRPRQRRSDDRNDRPRARPCSNCSSARTRRRGPLRWIRQEEVSIATRGTRAS